MLNILIAEGTPAVWQAERAGFGIPSDFSLCTAALLLHDPSIRCTPINIADGEEFPSGIMLSDFDAAMPQTDALDRRQLPYSAASSIAAPSQ